MVKPEHMSIAEKQFIRTYVQAMRRDFNLVESVMSLMHPDLLGITDVMTAVRIAVELQHMHAEFESTLHNTPSLRQFARKPIKAGPTIDDLADLFAMSFFKVFTVLENKKTAPKKKDAGWFSGQPDEWHQVFKQLESTEQESDKNQSSIFNMFSKFFPQLSLFKNFHLAQPPEDAPLNVWPNPLFPGLGLTKNQKPEYDEDEYEEYDDEDEE